MTDRTLKRKENEISVIPIDDVKLRLQNWFNNLFNEIISRQNSFIRSKGYYFRGLFTHTNPPSGSPEDDLIWDRENYSPDDRTEKWTDFYPELNVPLPASIKIDEWEYRNKRGWILTAKIVYNRETYTFSKAFGKISRIFNKDFSKEEI